MIQLFFFELLQFTAATSALEKSALRIFDSEKFAFARLLLRNEVPNFEVMREAIPFMKSNPCAPLNALLLINAQLIAIIAVPIPPPTDLLNNPPDSATIAKRI